MSSRRSGPAGAPRGRGPVSAQRKSPVPPLPPLDDRFLRFRAEAERLRREVFALSGPFFDRPSSDHALANLQVARVVFGKWSLDILVVLFTEQSVRFGELRRLLGGISSRVLSQKLKSLESLGLVQRVVESRRPPAVAYSLTEDGLTVARLGEPVFLFLRWRVRPATPAARADA